MQEKERKKEEEKEEKMRRTRVDTKCHAKPVWCWALWWCLVLSLVGGVEAHGFFGGCLVGLWTCIPLVGMLALMAPKKGKKKSHEGEGEEGEEGEEAGGGAAASVRSRSPRNRAKARRRSRGSKAEEVGEGEEEGGGAAVSGSAKRCHALCWAGNRCDGTKAGGTNFCRNHMRGQPHGIAGANSDHKGEEPAQEKRRRRKSSQKKPQRSEDFGEGAEEAVVHLLPQYQGPECEEMDIDMFFLPLALDKVGALSIFWNTHQAPAMKVFSERPNFLQLFHQPLALFVQMPKGAHPQAWKAEVCRALRSQGVEVPIPTSSNPFNGSCIVRRNVKCHWGSVARALRNLGLDVVHIGQYGCKVPLQDFKDSFEMGQPLQEGSAFDIAFQRRHTESIVLFGLQGGRGEVEVCGKPCKAYIAQKKSDALLQVSPGHWTLMIGTSYW